MIPFNKQILIGDELANIQQAYEQNKVSGDGSFTKWCSKFIEEQFGTPKALLTTSGTHALEMAMILIDLGPGDEVILPSYTFVSTANAVMLRGAKPVFVDVREDTLNKDEQRIEEPITTKTKAIFPVHYAGVGCEMDHIKEIARKYDLYVIEDAAQGVNAKYKEEYLGTIGDIGCYSFHETKNYSMGEGGAILINNKKFLERAEVVREKGTNRSKFFRGEVDKYTWVDIGSSYLPSEINAAILKVQFQHLDAIQSKRDQIFERYKSGLKELEESRRIRLPVIPDHCRGNSHLIYVLTQDINERTELITFLKEKGVHSVFHYVPLHQSRFYEKHFKKISLPKTEKLAARLLRLPMFYSLKMEEVDQVTQSVKEFYK